MSDIEVVLDNKPGSLALFGETLGKHHISLEGGGVFYNGETALAHFLVDDAERARTVLAKVGIQVVGIHRVLIQKLRQDVPGQLGQFCRRLAEAGVNIRVQYSDHANRLIVVVDDWQKGAQVSEAWQQQWG